MEAVATAIPAVIKLTPRRFGDARGFFCETWNTAVMAGLGLDTTFVQDNQSLSADRGTVRGLHYQRPPFAQTKLVRVGRGRILDIAVDVRRGSPSYGRWVGVELTAAGGEQLWVPKGFLHGFVTLEPDTEVLYKVDAPYSAEHDGAVRFDDPDLAIDWGPAATAPVLSAKDAAAPAFRDFDTPFGHEPRP